MYRTLEEKLRYTLYALLNALLLYRTLSKHATTLSKWHNAPVWWMRPPILLQRSTPLHCCCHTIPLTDQWAVVRQKENKTINRLTNFRIFCNPKQLKQYNIYILELVLVFICIYAYIYIEKWLFHCLVSKKSLKRVRLH